MRAILHDFKGYSSALELVADVPSADTFCQNMRGEMCFPWKTPLFLLIISARNLHRWRMTSSSFYLHLGEWSVQGCSLVWTCFCAFVWQTSISTLTFQALLRARVYPHPSNVSLKDSHHISQVTPNMTETILDFVFWEVAHVETWMNQPVWSRLNMHSPRGKFEKATCETGKCFSLVKR